MSDEGKLGFEYLFVDAPGKPAEYGLVYETPSKVQTIPLEFTFTDVPASLTGVLPLRHNTGADTRRPHPASGAQASRDPRFRLSYPIDRQFVFRPGFAIFPHRWYILWSNSEREGAAGPPGELRPFHPQARGVGHALRDAPHSCSPSEGGSPLHDAIQATSSFSVHASRRITRGATVALLLHGTPSDRLSGPVQRAASTS